MSIEYNAREMKIMELLTPPTTATDIKLMDEILSEAGYAKTDIESIPGDVWNDCLLKLNEMFNHHHDDKNS